MAEEVTLHSLDKQLSEVRLGQGEILKRINEHCQTDKLFQDKMDAALFGTPQTTGFFTRVDRLEQSESARRRHFGYLWAVILALGSSVFALFKK